MDVKHHPVSSYIETIAFSFRTNVFLKPQLDYTKNTTQDIYFLNSVEIKTDSLLFAFNDKFNESVFSIGI